MIKTIIRQAGTQGMDHQARQKFVDKKWDDEIVPVLVEYIRIPNKSPHFDPKWEEHGYMEDAVQHIFGWCKVQDLPGMSAEIVRLPGRTPLIFMEIPGSDTSKPGSDEDTIQLYGHLDKQPEMTGWAEGLGPWIPVIKDNKLYGRGGADDGYAAYGSLGTMPSSYCVLRQLLSRLEDEKTGRVLPEYLHADIPVQAIHVLT
jgi:hypothetical protein